MSPLPQAPPDDGGQSRHVPYKYVPTKPAQQWHAWTAGSCHWYQCHEKKRGIPKTKPCLVKMTAGELSCVYCALGDTDVQLGYLPLHRCIDTVPVMVIVNGAQRAVVDGFSLHHRVIIGRGAQYSDPVYAISAPVQSPAFQSTIAERMWSADLTEILLRMWSIADLIAWYRQTHGATPSPAPRVVPVKSDGSRYSPMVEAAAIRHGADVVPAQIANDVDAVREELAARMRAAKPSKNGKHPPKG